MYQGQTITAVIPARNEENAIGRVVADLKAVMPEAGLPLVDTILVCDNGSTDATAANAVRAGAEVVHQSQPGYGIACLTALRYLPPVDIVLFVDGDYSCIGEQAIRLVDAVAMGADLAVGSRTMGQTEPGALTTAQVFGNRLASFLIRRLWGVPVTDLGPYRAIRYSALEKLHMQDKRFGWTVEMQVKAIQQGMVVVERPVDTRRRIGQSKISGTLAGVVGAARGILGTIFKLWWQQRKQIEPQLNTTARDGESVSIVLRKGARSKHFSDEPR